MVPFEEAPGKICAFALLDGNEGRSSDQPFGQMNPLSTFPRYRPLESYGSWANETAIIFKPVHAPGHRPAEAGLGMLERRLSQPTEGIRKRRVRFF